MSAHSVLIWNVRGLNMRACRDAVRELWARERASILCRVKTKVDVLSQAMANDLMGLSFDYLCLPSVGASGGIIVAWRRDEWTSTGSVYRSFSLTVKLTPSGDLSARAVPWSLSVVYGPVLHSLKAHFLDELRVTASSANLPFLICGDFNLIYQAADKSNDRLNLRSMRQFRRALDDMQVDEIHLHGRLFTWSNERRFPTFERIDRAFASPEWLEAFPDHHLRSLSSKASDHAPLLLRLLCSLSGKPRFRFERFWTGFDGFHEAVARGWNCNTSSMDACRALDFKLRQTANALRC